MKHYNLRLELAAVLLLTAMLTGCSEGNPAETESAPGIKNFKKGRVFPAFFMSKTGFRESQGQIKPRSDQNGAGFHPRLFQPPVYHGKTG